MAMRMRNPAHPERTLRASWLVWAAVSAVVLLLVLRAEAAAQVSAYPRITGGEWVRGRFSTHMRSAESWAPGEPRWRREQPAPVGTSANILAAVGPCVYSFGGEFIASNVSGTLRTSQVFDVRSRTWSRLRTRVRTQPLDATGADNKHGTYGIAFRESGRTRIMAPGGASTAWFDPISKVHVFTPPQRC